MRHSLLIFLVFIFNAFVASAQKAKDTVVISNKNINRTFLREGTHRYLVYFKMQKDSVRIQTQFWTRTLKKIEYAGRPAIEVVQTWEDKDSIMHKVRSISDATTMQPLYHTTWWKIAASRNAATKSISETTVDFLNNIVEHDGRLLSESDTGNRVKAIWSGYTSSNNKYFLNWHLDLESLSLLPYKQGVTFLIPFYDPGTGSGFQEVPYTVSGSGELTGFNDQRIDCWLLVHESKGNKEVFWISKKTQEVLKLEQEINGRIYRYKIKLGFSM